MLGEPGLVEAQPLGELNLLEQFFEALGLRHPGSRLVVTESPKTYAPFLTQDLTVTQWMTLRRRLTTIRNYSARELLPDEHQASPKSYFYPVPQNALYVSPVPRLQLSWNGVSTG